MGVVAAKDKLKEIISFNLIDVQGEINTKGNYVHLNSTSKASVLETKYNFIVTIAGHSLTGSEESIEPILTQALKDIYNYEISNAKDLEPSSKVIGLNELIGYELKISIIDKTKD
ncbi:MAG: hypothetical protein AB7D41_03635 [Arcobacter sp.]|jgi:hypothetical protein|uniref:hypothetical protein n=1 Tax=Arcobacter sp. TaxID=1872629 RepID=UPI003D052E41